MVPSAITTKAMREAARCLRGFTRHDVYGVSLDLDPQAAIDRLRSRAARVAAMMSDAVVENLRRHDISYVTGVARLGPDRTVLVDPVEGGTTCVLAAEAIMVATGSHPYHPPHIPFDDPDVLDSETALALDRLIESMVVGGGAVACEYASIFLALGAEITLVDRGTRLLPFLDAELSALLADSFRSYGMRILSGSAVARVTRNGAGCASIPRTASRSGAPRSCSQPAAWATPQTSD
jgi:NAD(P) transhydrogenase